jgi:hypothetical protein
LGNEEEEEGDLRAIKIEKKWRQEELKNMAYEN